jgi:MinD-like ATPase involved in chromosome partitioning or flagellar assembly
MRTPVMEGSLSEFDLSSVMQVVSLGRQYTGVDLFDESGSLVGTLCLKSGKILDAKTGSLSGLDAVNMLLRDSRRKRFLVYRTERFSDALRPVGSVGEVLLKMMASEAATPERIAVMEGSLSEFDLLTVLQVVSIGRQFTGVEVFGPGDRLLGCIELKAGKVVSAKSDHLDGVDAIRRLLRSPSDSRFVVNRSKSEVGEQHVGSLAQILMQLADVDGVWEESEENTQARRPVAPKAPSEAPPSTRLKREKRETPEEPQPSPFVDTYTSPFGLTTLPLAAGEVPVVCVTSPKGGAGKTTVALNLAVALARQGKRVVLIDADYDGVLLALNVKARMKAGAYDVAAGRAKLSDAAIKTRISGLRIVQSGEASAASASAAQGWVAMYREAKADSDIVLIDTSAGLRGPSGHACAAATHALVVVPAEPAGIRGLPAHLQAIESLGPPAPKVAGIVLNMLDYKMRVSLDALRDLCGGPSAPWVFDIPIARSPRFMEAVARGVPVCRGDRNDMPTIGWVFEMLASSILERLGIATTVVDEAPLV